MEPETVLWCVFPPRTLGTQAVHPLRDGEQGVCSPVYARWRIGAERTELGPSHVYTFGGWFNFLNCPMSQQIIRELIPSLPLLYVEKYIYWGIYKCIQIYSQIKWNFSLMATVGLRVKLTCTVNAS